MLRRLQIQTALTVPPQRLTSHEREYLVAPCSMIVEGVLNGGLVPGEEIRACRWDGIPIVLNHPRDAEGEPISANQPDVLALYGMGRVFDTSYLISQRGQVQLVRAQASLWLDIAECQRLGGEAADCLTMLETQTPLECSTAFWSDAEPAHGTFLGQPYSEIHRNLRADHLALLPSGVGACNWEDGCGCPRLNEETQAVTTPTELFSTWRTTFAALRRFWRTAEANLEAFQTDVDIREALYGALARELGVDYTSIWLDSVNATEQTFTYRQGERLIQRGWTVQDDVLVLLPDSQDVQRETTFVPVQNAALAEQETPTMAHPPEARKATVTALIMNQLSPWEETDRAMLEGLPDQKLDHLVTLCTPVTATAQPGTPVVQAAQTTQEPPTLAAVMEQIHPQYRGVFTTLLKEHDTRRAAALAVLTQHGCAPQPAVLAVMELEDLEKMARALQAQADVAAGADYAALGLPHVRPQASDTAPPTPLDTFAEALKIRQQRAGLAVA
jgi:hypothetical protein